MTHTWLWLGIAGAATLGVVTTAVAAGFPGQGVDALKAGAPVSNVERVHFPPHVLCRRHGLRCHFHPRKGKKALSCNPMRCRPYWPPKKK
jgi:hypothetical protein